MPNKLLLILSYLVCWAEFLLDNRSDNAKTEGQVGKQLAKLQVSKDL
jgi:hypothetical protein